jgi:hypothetical protein
LAIAVGVGIVGAGIVGFVRASVADPDTVSAAADRMLDAVPPAEPRRWWDGELSAAGDCVVREHATALEVEQGCRIALGERFTTIDAWSDLVVSRSEGGFAIVDGSALISVDPDRPAGAGLRVSVPHARIDVIGTRFAVSVTADGGHLDLLEGSIALSHEPRSEVAPVLVVPGCRVRWSAAGVERSEAPEIAMPGDRRVVRPALARPARSRVRRDGQDELDAALDEVSRLRVQGDWSAALHTLRSARRGVADERVAEVLSFEEGTLREKVDREEEACAYWRGHLARFPDGHYRVAVERRLESCREG